MEGDARIKSGHDGYRAHTSPASASHRAASQLSPRPPSRGPATVLVAGSAVDPALHRLQHRRQPWVDPGSGAGVTKRGAPGRDGLPESHIPSRPVSGAPADLATRRFAPLFVTPDLIRGPVRPLRRARRSCPLSNDGGSRESRGWALDQVRGDRGGVGLPLCRPGPRAGAQHSRCGRPDGRACPPTAAAAGKAAAGPRIKSGVTIRGTPGSIPDRLPLPPPVENRPSRRGLPRTVPGLVPGNRGP